MYVSDSEDIILVHAHTLHVRCAHPADEYVHASEVLCTQEQLLVGQCMQHIERS